MFLDRKIYDENFHEWKIIPSYIIKKIFRENFIFRPCFEPSISSLKIVPNFYEEMITNWAKSLSCSLTYHQQFFPSFYGLTWTLKLTIRAFLSLTLRVKTSILSFRFFTKNGKTKSWDYIKSEYNLETKLKYRWIHLTDTSPKLWKDCILNCIENSINLCICNLFIFII